MFLEGWDEEASSRKGMELYLDSDIKHKAMQEHNDLGRFKHEAWQVA